DEREGAGGAGGRRDDVDGGRAGAPQVLVGGIEDDLVVGVGVYGGHQTAADAKRIEHDLSHGGQAVRRAGRVRDDGVSIGVVGLLVDTEDDRDVLALGRGGDDYLLCTGLDVRLRLVGVGETTGRLDNHVDALVAPGKLRRLALGEDLDGPGV